MYQTNYHRASSLDEAVALLEKSEEGKLLAGGQTLLPTMKQRLAAPSDLVDIRRIAGLSGISVESGRIRIGATTSHAEVANSAELASVCPALASLAASIGDPHVRHMGTIGGSLANNDPAADYPAGILGLAATIVTNERSIAADDYFTGLFETALGPNEVITAVEFDVPAAAAYAKFPNPASRYAMTGVFVARQADGSVRVAVTGAGADGVFRSAAMESALSSSFAANALDAVEIAPEDLLSDLHASAEYRANLVKAMAQRAVAALASA